MSNTRRPIIHITFDSDEESSSTESSDNLHFNPKVSLSRRHPPSFNHSIKLHHRLYITSQSFQRRTYIQNQNLHEDSKNPHKFHNEEIIPLNQNNLHTSNPKRVQLGEKPIPQIDNQICFSGPKSMNYRTFVLEKNRSSIFQKSSCFKFLERGQVLFEQTIKISNSCKLFLPGKVLLHIQNKRSYFEIKGNGSENGYLAQITFLSFDIDDSFKRKIQIKFGHFGFSLPNKLVSLPNLDEDSFGGHFMIKSKRNVSLSKINSSYPLLCVRQITKNSVEIDTVLNLPVFILYAIAMALYNGENYEREIEFSQNSIPLLRAAKNLL